MPLRVLVDASALPENRGGVGRYVDELVARLPALGVDAHVAAQPRDQSRYAAALGADRVHLVPGWANPSATRLGWEQTGLPLLVRRIRPNVLHSPHYTLPLATTIGHVARSVVTVHDATFFSDPDLHIGVKARFFRAWTHVSARLADALVAPSDATKDEIARYVGAQPDRIAVIPHGVDHQHFRPPTNAAVAQAREWLGLETGEAYVAFLGTLEPRKNIPALVEAYAAASAGRADPPALVLAGGRGWDDAIEPAVAAIRPPLRVLRPGFVPDHLVPGLLGGAQVVAYPGFGEGFGLPVLEAMACGAAVLTTRRLSLTEVGGDAVCYASSPAAGDIAVALTALLDDGAGRTELAARGVERAAGYTWEAVARGHVAVYEEVCAR
jgi:glycosyltransferase involved in cell wall biosynthesis